MGELSPTEHQNQINPTEEPLDVILATLHERNIRSVLVEGGAELIRHFMEHGLWDEARVIHGQVHFGDGTPAPRIDGAGRIERMVGGDRIVLHRREAGCIAWDW